MNNAPITLATYVQAHYKHNIVVTKVCGYSSHASYSTQVSAPTEFFLSARISMEE